MGTSLNLQHSTVQHTYSLCMHACLPTSLPCLCHCPCRRFKGLWGLGAVAQKLAKKSLEQSFADMPAIIDK